MALSMTLTGLAGDYAIARLDAGSPIPDWADGAGFVSIGRTAEELSIVCHSDRIPTGTRSDGPWMAFKLEGPFDLSETGIAVAVLNPLAVAKIGVFIVSTFDTDYFLIKRENAMQAMTVFKNAGHRVDTP
jgi:uncharacterized protein